VGENVARKTVHTQHGEVQGDAYLTKVEDDAINQAALPVLVEALHFVFRMEVDTIANYCHNKIDFKASAISSSAIKCF